VIFLIALVALFFEVILSYITCFTIFRIVAAELKSINFSALAFGITFDKAIYIDWLIVIISLVVANLLVLLIESSLWGICSKDEILSKEELVFFLSHLYIKIFTYLVFVLKIIGSGQEGFSSVYYNVGELMATSGNTSLFNTGAEFAKLLTRLYFKYRVLVETLNYLEDIYTKVSVKNL
jgi:hypothetical protein